MGAKSFATSGSVVGYDFLLNDIQDRLDPFDNDAFEKNPMSLYAVATDVVFGTPAYLPVENAVLDVDALRATTSLPLMTQPVEMGDAIYLDGGVADSVPVEHALEDAGFDKAIVVLTQDRTYKKGPYEFLAAVHARYAAYPYLLRRLRTATSATTSSVSTFGSTSAKVGRWSSLRRSRSRWAISSMIPLSCWLFISKVAKKASAGLMRCVHLSLKSVNRRVSITSMAVLKTVCRLCRNSGRQPKMR